MKQTLTKLKSNTGSTLIIALLFMLVCVFVGGSVLVAATVNGNRIAGERTQQQAILNQRSLCSVFVKTLQNSNGDFDISLPYTTSAQIKNPSNKYDSSTDALKYTICKAAEKTCKDNQQNSVSFSVTDSQGNEIACTAVCMPGFNVYIRFEENPQVQLQLSGRDSNSAISWYGAKIIKAVTK